VTDGQDEKKSRTGADAGKGAVYQGAFEAVVALLIAAGLGYWMDGYFETAPWLLLTGIAIGFASFTVRLVRLGRWMRHQVSDDTTKTDENGL
jgi:F0F1-type ATP synthase assembly protein I